MQEKIEANAKTNAVTCDGTISTSVPDVLHLCSKYLWKAAKKWFARLKETKHLPNGALPVKYVGVPVVYTKLSLRDCSGLITKIVAKIQGWANKTVSYAVRLQQNRSWLSIASHKEGSGFDTLISLGFAIATVEHEVSDASQNPYNCLPSMHSGLVNARWQSLSNEV